MGQVEVGNIRGFQLSRQTRLPYTVRDDKIIVLAFFDVRQDPDKVPLSTYSLKQHVIFTEINLHCAKNT
ncbi:hypothetical protein ACKGJN_13335 [Gillisia sp. Q332]|uniref:hypothetical protein n=1 Tax=Gillisia xinjiangensis TaxID=3384765 RepID=UPI003919BCD8